MNRCKKCSGIIIRTESCTDVCTTCGRERKILTLYDTSCMNKQGITVHSALTYSYNRRMRFKNYIDQVTGFSNGPAYSAKIWELLKDNAPYPTIDDLLKTMSKVKCKHKFYDSILSFCKAFVTDFKVPPNLSLETKNIILKRFDTLLCRWEGECQSSELFFSYPWLVKKLLNEQNIYDYDTVIKKLRCKKRIRKYEKLFKHLDEQLCVPECEIRELQSPCLGREVHRESNLPEKLARCNQSREGLAFELLKQLTAAGKQEPEDEQNHCDMRHTTSDKAPTSN